MAKNLKNTLLVDNEEYNINAVYSDEAGKVSQPLTIKKYSLEGNGIAESCSYNGSLDSKETTITEINYVPATGGVFMGDVQINTPDDELTDSSILNRAQIAAQTELLQGNPLYTWRDGKLAEVTNNEEQLYKINTIVGATQDFHVFKSLISNGSDGLKYTVHNIINNSDFSKAWCSVTGYEGTDTRLIIPYVYTYTDTWGYKHDLPVKAIKEKAFSGNNTILTVFIPNSITKIGEGAFKECSSLIKAELPDSISYIGYQTFYECTSLLEVKIPSSIKRIGDQAFFKCGFTSFTIPDSVISVGDSVFAKCVNLIQLTIGNNVRTFGYGGSGLGDSPDLKYTESDGLLYLGSSDNPYFYLAKRKDAAVQTAVINSNCKIIGSSAFSYTNIVSIDIPEGVVEIGNSAFSNCTNLTTISLPNSLRSIGSDAFKGCTKLVFNEYDNAYYLGNSSNTYIALIKAKDTSITSCDINKNTKIICYSAFNGCTKEGFAGVNLPSGLIQIGKEAFYNCTRFKNINIPDSVESIHESAYASNNATSVTLGVGLLYLGQSVFDDDRLGEATLNYTGNADAWALIDIRSSGNSFLTNSSINFLNTSISPYYTVDNNSATSNIDFNLVRNEPFIYICRDVVSGAGALDSDLNSANTMYLKMPNDNTITEISRGATRLDSVYNTANEQSYYTYEGLAEIIAKINLRLEALGGNDLALSSAVIAPLHSLEEVNSLVPDKEITADIDPAIVPTVQQLEEAIVKISGLAGDNNKIQQVIENCAETLAKLRSDLDTLTSEVTHELSGNEERETFIANTRIDRLEDWKEQVIQIVTWDDEE